MRPLLLLLVACDGKSSAEVEITDVSATVSEEVGTVVTVTWTTSEASTGFVRYGDGMETPLESSAATAHSALLLGLTAEEEVSYQVVLETDSGQIEGESQTVTTGILPNSLPVLTAEGDGHDLYTVVSVLGAATGPAIFNSDGKFVWYHEDDRDLDTYRARLSSDGLSILYNAANVSGEPSPDSALVRISLDGTEETVYPVPYLAHDFVELPDGTLATIVVEYGELDGETIRGDSLVEVAADGTLSTVWSAWDCFDPSVDIGTDSEIGWTFANALDYDPDEDAWLLSIRNFSSIVQIDRATGTCDWVFGSTAATITPASGSESFLHEHQFERLDDSILIFDNAGAGSTSRAVEYAFDPSSATAEQIWSFVPDPEIFTFVLGDVARMDNGDTLVDWAVAGEIDRVTAAGEVSWRVNTSLGYAFGFMQPVGDLYAGE